MNFIKSLKKEKKYSSLLFFSFFFLLFWFVFRNLLLNISRNLIDTRDYSLMLWIMSQNLEKITSLSFSNYFNTSTFYPYKYALLFSDLLLPQSLISLPFFIISKNLIFSFNMTFIINFLLNYSSLFIFWKSIFKNKLIAFLGSIFFIFSPFFHLELSHFQMQSYWPFFLSLYFLNRSSEKVQKQSKKVYFLALSSGFFLAVQFLSSVYLALYLIFAISIYLFIYLLTTKNLKQTIKVFFTIFAIFILIDGYVIQNYNDMKNYYKIDRELGELVTYSANISDYLFTGSIDSLLHKSAFMDKWNSFNKNIWGGRASSPGILLSFLFLLTFLKFTAKKTELNISLNLTPQKSFFLVLILIGLIFSLGPRAKFNGNYAEIPLPFTLVMKTIPIVQSARASSRWSFLFYLGIIYFCLLTISNLSKSNKYPVYISVILIFFLVEYIPLNLKSEKSFHLDGNYTLLKDLCSKQKLVLLELPITHLDSGENIIQGLTYINGVQLASSYHKCNIVNGYSGYDLPQLFKLKDEINASIITQNIDKFLQILNDNHVDIIKINKGYLIKEVQEAGPQFYEKLENQKNVRVLDQNIYKIQKNNTLKILSR